MNSVKQSLRLQRVIRRSRRSGSYMDITEEQMSAAVDIHVRRTRRRYRVALDDINGDQLSKRQPVHIKRNVQQAERMLASFA